MPNKNVVVIGAGFAGISAATHLSASGYRVTVLEKNQGPGGRARQFEAEGFVFDMGPSWYWMPDVFENYFAHFGKKTSDYYRLERLDPSYTVFFGKDDFLTIPAEYKAFRAMVESLEPGAGSNLDEFLSQAAYKYRVGIQDLVYKPSRSIWEFTSPKLLMDMVRMDIFQSMAKHIRKFFKHERIIRLMEFPVLFLGGTAENIPALYSLMNFADISLGTWYPMGGMYKVVEGMVSLAEENGVKFEYGAAVSGIGIRNGLVRNVSVADGRVFEADVVVAGADYQHVESKLLPPSFQNYSASYWDKRVMAPSSLLFYLGVNKKLERITHHCLFFDEPMAPHADAIYSNPRWPEKPLFYVSAASVTDPGVAKEGTENLVILLPLAPDLQDTEDLREKYFNIVLDRLENLTGQDIRSHIVFKRSYAHTDFKADYNAFKGNAYGLANTLLQTAILKPSLKNKHLANMYYTGQLTVPGPGVPPSLISGQVVANEILKEHKP